MYVYQSKIAILLSKNWNESFDPNEPIPSNESDSPALALLRRRHVMNINEPNLLWLGLATGY